LGRPGDHDNLFVFHAYSMHQKRRLVTVRRFCHAEPTAGMVQADPCPVNRTNGDTRPLIAVHSDDFYNMRCHRTALGHELNAFTHGC